MESLQDGRYELRDVLGRGGMATVYRAWDNRLRVDRAIKILADNLASRPKLRDRFEDEARTMARLHHPNMVTVMDVGQEGDRFYMVMELVDGGSLQDRIKHFGALTPRQGSEVMQSVLAALYLAHSRGVVHRDIKPHNVLLTAEGVPKLTDFGIAQIQSMDTRTRTGAVMGTLAYMAPEQQHNAKGVDARADIYAVGATLCALVKGGEPSETLYVQEAHAKVFVGLPEPLITIIKRACRYSAEDRFGTAEEMRSALEHAHDLLPEDPDDAVALGTPLPQLDQGVWSRTLQPAAESQPPPPSETWSGEGMYVERQTPMSRAEGKGQPPPVPAGRSKETISFGDFDEVAEPAADPFASIPPSHPPSDPSSAGSTAFEAQSVARRKKRGIVAAMGIGVVALVIAAGLEQGAEPEPTAGSPAPTRSAAPATPPEPEPEPTPTAAEVEAPTPEPIPEPEAGTSAPQPAPVERTRAEARPAEPAPAREPAAPEPEPESDPALAAARPDPPAPEPVAITGRLMVNSIPWSQLTLDGDPKGTTDWSGSTTSGRHNLVLTTSDGRVHRKTVTVPADGVMRYCWDFREAAPCSR